MTQTVLFLKNFAQLNAMWRLLEIWERATGMKLNRSKTEGIALGKLKGRAARGPAAEGITWIPPGGFTISLGIPIGTDLDTSIFFEAKYLKCKALLANWLSIQCLTTMG